MQRSLPDNTQHSKEKDVSAPAGFEPTIPTFELPQTHALDLTVTGICIEVSLPNKIHPFLFSILKISLSLNEGRL